MRTELALRFPTELVGEKTLLPVLVSVAQAGPSAAERFLSSLLPTSATPTRA